MTEVAVIGGGAAGLMASIFAARSGARATLFEATPSGGKKILISGGGRCNVLPARLEPERFVTASSRNSLRKILKGWPLPEQKRFFEHDLRIPLKLESDSGKLFPVSNRARDVRDGLLRAVQKEGVTRRFEAVVTDIRPGDGRWTVVLADRSEAIFDAVIIATGGLSVPATGSDGFGIRLARRLDVAVNDTYPALTPLLAHPAAHANLAGISPDVTIRVAGANPRFETTGGFLFTHRGYSGPSVLDASHHVTMHGDMKPIHAEIRVNWCSIEPSEWDDLLRGQKGLVRKVLGRSMPERLAEQLVGEAGIEADATGPHLPKKLRQRLVSLLTDYRLPVTGHEGYKKAEVTGGGVDVGEIDPVSMESRKHPGLFFCGEVLDAFGPIGGHNFLWAWVTGRAAGTGSAE